MELERLSFKDGYVPSKIFQDYFYFDTLQLNEKVNTYSRVITPAGKYEGDYYHIRLIRRANEEDLKHLNMTLMPGFKAKWSYKSDENFRFDEYDDSHRQGFIRLVNVLAKTNQSMDEVWKHVKITRKKLVGYYMKNLNMIEDCKNNMIKIKVKPNITYKT